MNKTVNFISKIDIQSVVDCFSPDEIDYFIITKKISRGGVRYFATIHFTNLLNLAEIAYRIADFIIINYEDYMLCRVLRRNFVDFSDSDRNGIIKTAKTSMMVFNTIYNKILFVNYLTNCLKYKNTINFEGFLNFRVKEYIKIIRMVLNDSIEQFYVMKEYDELIELITDYVAQSKSQIGLIHINVLENGKFTLYNLKKEKIVFEIDDINPIEFFLIDADMLVSILITLAPKRIIWHDKSNINLNNIKRTLTKIFADRISECPGCKLCENKYI